MAVPTTAQVSFLNDMCPVANNLQLGSRLNALDTDASFHLSTTLAQALVQSAIRIGNWVAAGAKGGAVPFAAALDLNSDLQLDVVAAFGESTSNLTSSYSAKVGRFRHLAVGASAALTMDQEMYGLVGQLVIKSVTLTHLHAGLMGTFEGNATASVLSSTYTVGHAAVIGRIGGHAFITATTPLAGFLAFNNQSAPLTGGTLAAFAASARSATYPWSVGIYMPVGSVNQAIRIGHWKTAGGVGNAIPISAVTDSDDTTQRNVVAVYGESTSNLGVGIHANVGRFRHLVSGSSLQVNHETYGLVGQLVGKSASLLHMHAGLMGTLEANTTALECKGAYAYSVAAVIARIGGGGLITATNAIAGFSSILNGADVAAGSIAAFAATVTAAGRWTWGLSLGGCDEAFNFLTTGACVSAHSVGSPTSGKQILVSVDGSPYAMALYAVGTG